jgi:hypothetical protein
MTDQERYLKGKEVMGLVSGFDDTIGEIKEVLLEAGAEDMAAEVAKELGDILENEYNVIYTQVGNVLTREDWLDPQNPFNNAIDKKKGSAVIDTIEVQKYKLENAIRKVLVKSGLYPMVEPPKHVGSSDPDYKTGILIADEVRHISSIMFNRVQDILISENLLDTNEEPAVGSFEAEMADFFPDSDIENREEELHTSTLILLDANERLDNFRMDVIRAVKQTNNAQSLGESILKLIALEAIGVGKRAVGA